MLKVSYTVFYALRWSIPSKVRLSMGDAPCRVGERRGKGVGVLSCYICICSCIASITMLHLYLQLYRHCTCCSMKTCCLLNLLLLLLLLLILYIDFQQLHSRHRQTYIFCHCFKQSEYSTADECIKCYPTYMAGRLWKRVTE